MADLSSSQIGQISITVQDLKTSNGFYVGKLGLRFLFETPEMAFLQIGDIRLMLATPSQSPTQHRSSVIYFTTEDIRATHETLSTRDVSFETEPHLVHKTDDSELWMAFFKDPDENIHALMQEKRS